MNNLRYKLRLAWQFELSGKPPFSFEFTVHKPRYGYWLTPFEIYEDSRIWSGLTLLGGTPVGLKLQSIGTLLRPRVIINVFHAGALKNEEQKEILQLVLECLRIEEDISEFYALAEQLPILKQAKQDLYGMRDTHFPDLFNGIILAVTLQMTTWQRSLEMMNSLYLTYGERIEFDGREVILAPSLATIAKANPVELKERCKLGYRANFLQAIARRIEEGFPSLIERPQTSRLLGPLPSTHSHLAQPPSRDDQLQTLTHPTSTCLPKTSLDSSLIFPLPTAGVANLALGDMILPTR